LPVKLAKPINHPLYSSTMPAVATDQKKGTDVLFFASDRKGGKGKMDIWYAVYDKKLGKFAAPKNAGSKINTIQDEIAPYFDHESQTLYFSSEGQGGLGGLDIFRATGNGRKFSMIENVGEPYNSGADDIYFSIAKNRQEGFFVSNRKGGNALKNSTCCDDIYTFKKTDYIHITLAGDVSDPLKPDEKIRDADVEIYLRDKQTRQPVLVKTIRSDSAGHYSTKVEPGNDYFIVTKKSDYLGTTADIPTHNIMKDTMLSKDLSLTRRPKETIHIPNIQYEFDKGALMEASKITLDTTIYELLVANPELIVELESHTDSKGSDSYNIKLSQKRAESVVRYLVEKGIDPSRLKAKGYGESRPVAPNENPDGSDNPDGRAKNRRTGFRIIGTIDAEVTSDADK
jgi:OmpA-OmpF porin, OOP family